MRFSGRRAKYARRGSGRQSRRGKGPRHQETSGREGPHPVRRNRKIPLLFVHENSVRIPIGMLPIENFTWPKPLGKGSLPVSPSAVNQTSSPRLPSFSDSANGPRQTCIAIARLLCSSSGPTSRHGILMRIDRR